MIAYLLTVYSLVKKNNPSTVICTQWGRSVLGLAGRGQKMATGQKLNIHM